METRLYVGNLADDASSASLRARFAKFGEVADLRIAVDRGSGRSLGHAFVTMATHAGAQAALARLNGALFEDRPLKVRIAGEPRDEAPPKAVDPARITSQFRERLNMAYELDCAGVALTIRVFHAADVPDEARRIEASVSGKNDATGRVVAASGRTRALALADVAREWSEQSLATGRFQLDWVAITNAMTAVRAI